MAIVLSLSTGVEATLFAKRYGIKLDDSLFETQSALFLAELSRECRNCSTIYGSKECEPAGNGVEV